MTLDITTPALVFPATTLLILAYTQRFSRLSDHIRRFVEAKKTHSDAVLEFQIKNFHRRIYLVQRTEAFGVLGLILSLLSSLSLLVEMDQVGLILFVMSLSSILLSLGFALWEIMLSTASLQVLLQTEAPKASKVKNLWSRWHKGS